MSKQVKVSTREMYNLIEKLNARKDTKRELISEKELEPHLIRLREIQTARLRNTYADLFSDPQYFLAGEFFLKDIYGVQDFSQRNYDAERLYAIMSRFLPEIALQLLSDTIRLNRMTDQLDHLLSRILADMVDQKGEITQQDYIKGFRLCDNYAARKLQIDLATRVLKEAVQGARRRFFSAGLRMVRIPATRAGWKDTCDFLECGAQACKPMRNVNYFIQTIQQRELKILDQIYAGVPDLFSIE